MTAIEAIAFVRKCQTNPESAFTTDLACELVDIIYKERKDMIAECAAHFIKAMEGKP